MGGSRSGKSNALLSLVTRLWLYVFDKIYLYVKYPNEAKYEYPIKNVEKKWFGKPAEYKGCYYIFK